jgi:O-methyltransferase
MPSSAPQGELRQRFAWVRPAFLMAQRLARKFGFELTFARVSGIKDAELYWPFFQPWRQPQWQERLRIGDDHSLLAPEARYYLYTTAADALQRAMGQAAECGVYRGGTAKILAELAASHSRRLMLFDTFAGMPETDPTKDLHRQGDFADTSAEAVREYVGNSATVELYPGLIPESLAPAAEAAFAFVHVDLDIYRAVLDAASFFYPRLSPGGALLFDDYGFASCPGARAAVDEFFADKPEIPVALPTGQCVVRKL